MPACYTVYLNTDYHHTERRYAKCHSAECRYAECHGILTAPYRELGFILDKCLGQIKEVVWTQLRNCISQLINFPEHIKKLLKVDTIFSRNKLACLSLNLVNRHALEHNL
jgi:hypothetical protein